MVRRCWGLILCCLLYPSLSRGQEKQLRFSTAEKFIADTTRLSKQITSIKSLRHKATDSGMALYRTALQESRNVGYIDGVARSLTGMGLFYMDKGEYDKSLAMYQLAKPYCEAATYGKGLLIVLLYNN